MEGTSSNRRRLPPRWFMFREFGDDPDDHADRRPGPTEVVVLEPA